MDAVLISECIVIIVIKNSGKGSMPNSMITTMITSKTRMKYVE